MGKYINRPLKTVIDRLNTGKPETPDTKPNAK